MLQFKTSQNISNSYCLITEVKSWLILGWVTRPLEVPLVVHVRKLG